MKVQVYEWLRGDGLAFISIPRPTNAELKYDLSDIDGFSWCISSRHFLNTTHSQHQFAFFKSETYSDRASVNGLNVVSNNYPISGVLTISDGYAKANGESVKIESTLIIENWSLFRAENESIRPSYARIGYYISDTLHLKPCKLLTPYQSHQAGECAMIDVLTNTLYFNQGTGSFSVEGEALEIIDTTPVINNIISKESKIAVRLREWIIGSLGFIKLPIKSLRCKVQSATDNSGVIFRFVSATYRAIQCLFYGKNIHVYTGSTYVYQVEGFADIELNSEHLSINGINVFNNIGDVSDLGIFNTLSQSVHQGFVEIGCINENLHPAELALPYGNHPIGEACMINLLSGDLYFNQGSGSFSCKGAFLGYWQDKPMTDHYCDVEGTLHRSVQIFADNGEKLRLIWEKNFPFTTHRWLKVNIPNSGSSITTLNIPLSANVKKYAFKFVERKFGNNGFLRSNDSASSYIDNGAISSIKLGGVVADISLNEIVDVEFKDGVLYINNTQTPYVWDGFGASWYTFRGIDRDISKIVADTFTLTPAILSRPTLAEEDNNGIARKQGEAVFVDEERYKQGLLWVFGNVATSGSFSVSDYLIEGEDYERVSGVVISSNQFVGVNYAPTKWSDITISGDAIFASTKPSYICVKRGDFDMFDGKFIGLTYHNIYDLEFTYVISYDGDNAIFSKAKGSNILEVNGLSATLIDNTFTALRLGYFGERSDLIVKAFEFSATDMSFNLIPVRLLRNIETYTTHNGKGGKVGEIGFFDSVSGKFYGNDGSGEFTEYIP